MTVSSLLYGVSIVLCVSHEYSSSERKIIHVGLIKEAIVHESSLSSSFTVGEICYLLINGISVPFI